MNLTDIIPYVVGYFSISLVFLIFNAVVAGYNGNTYSFQDTKDSILWPLSLAVLVGLLIRIAMENYKEKRSTKPKQKHKK